MIFAHKFHMKHKKNNYFYLSSQLIQLLMAIVILNNCAIAIINGELDKTERMCAALHFVCCVWPIVWRAISTNLVLFKHDHGQRNLKCTSTNFFFPSPLNFNLAMAKLWRSFGIATFLFTVFVNLILFRFFSI